MRALKLALKGHKGIPVPLWVSVLIMAETWGEHPEDIIKRRGSLKWSRRFGLLQRARADASEEERRKMERKAKRR